MKTKKLGGLPEGSYVHQLYTRENELRRKYDYLPYDSIKKIIDALLRGEVSHALLPFSNNNGGGVGPLIEGFRDLSEGGAQVVGQYRMVIEHILAGKNGTNREELRGISSQLQALRQSSRKLVGLGANTTSLFAKELKIPQKDGYKPLFLKLDGNQAGALGAILKVFKENNINLAYINSMPIGNGEYAFSFLIECKTDISDLVDKIGNAGGKLVEKDQVYDSNGIGSIILKQTEATVTDWMCARTDETQAIICGEQALRQSGLVILDENMAPRGNETRFNLVSRKKAGEKETIVPKVLVLLSLKDESGSLCDAIEKIAELGLSIDYIHSQENGSGGYGFYMEMDRGQNGEAITLQKEILNMGGDIKVL